jgi:hypothetical protein
MFSNLIAGTMIRVTPAARARDNFVSVRVEELYIEMKVSVNQMHGNPPYYRALLHNFKKRLDSYIYHLSVTA